MPKLLGLDLFTGNGFLRFLFPSLEVPYGYRIAYEGDDVADLTKEFLINKRGKAAGTVSSSSVGDYADVATTAASAEGTEVLAASLIADFMKRPATVASVGGRRLKKRILTILARQWSSTTKARCWIVEGYHKSW